MMKRTHFRGALLATILVGCSTHAMAQAAAPPAVAPAATPDDRWKTAVEIPLVDFTGLSAAQKTSALTIMRTEGCACGCGMIIAECRFKDPNCPASPKLAAAVVQGVRDGKSADVIKASLGAAYQKATPPPAQQQPPATLGPAVEIPTAGSPFKGEPSAKIALIEFSDFQ